VPVGFTIGRWLQARYEWDVFCEDYLKAKEYTMKNWMLGVLVLAGLATHSQAAELAIQNSSFEDPAVTTWTLITE
jgi:hypothetical protein